jgi:hypothetical protein
MAERDGNKRDAAPAEVATATVAADDEAAALLMQRLQSQFGDMDLSHLDSAPPATDNAEGEAESEESSAVEPTAEELRIWQEAQFKLGAWAEKAKKEHEMSQAELEANALQRLRRERQGGGASKVDAEWAEVHPPPDLDGQASMFLSTKAALEDAVDTDFVGVNPIMSKLAAGDPEILGGKWRRIYSSVSDGLSFQQVLAALRGYEGPTVMLIGTTPSEEHSLVSTSGKTDGTLGFFTATPWQESKHLYGTEDCFLFSIHKKEVTICRPTNDAKTKNKFMYCNPSSTPGTAKHETAACFGIGVGGTSSNPRLHLTENLEHCRALPSDATFEPAELLPGGDNSLYYFDVDAMEIWGVGGEGWIKGALQARASMRIKREANLKQARTVDKAQFLDDFRSCMVENDSLFGHVEHVAGRTDSSR